MPAVQACILEPLWVQFSSLLPQNRASHPLGCHRHRLPDRLVFDKLVQMLRFGCSYRAIADHTCSATTLRRRRDEWLRADLFSQLERVVLLAYDRMIGLELSDLAVDGCITKAPSGGECAGRSPVDRGKRGLKRSLLVEANGIPLGVVIAPAGAHDSPLLAPTLDSLQSWTPEIGAATVHLDRGYDSDKTRDERRGLGAQISRRGRAAPLQVGQRWVVERTHSWVNNYAKLVRCDERRGVVIRLWLSLAHSLIILGRLIRQAWLRYRWDGRPPRRP